MMKPENEAGAANEKGELKWGCILLMKQTDA